MRADRQRHRTLKQIGGLIGATVFLGASALNSQVKKPPPKKPPPAATQEKTADVATVDAAGLKNLLAQSRGEILVINFWATWCPPCIREMPVFAKVARHYEDHDVRMVAISMDEPKDHPAVTRFAGKFSGPLHFLRGGHGQEREFINITEPRWNGSLPATIFYDREGKRSFTHVGALNEESLLGAIESLLPSPKKPPAR